MKTIIKIFLIAGLFSSFSCGKEFLDIKRDIKQVMPSKIQHFQGMLDYRTTMNSFSSYELSIIGTDEYQVSDENWSLLKQPFQKNAYIWADDVYERNTLDDWEKAYHRILIANMALEGIEKVKPAEDEGYAWNNVKGSALFVRAMNHYQLAQLFCKPYNTVTAANDLGIPLRLDSDITLKVGRGKLQNVYDQIINDLEQALPLLPDEPLVKFRPSKVAAFALLARVYLQMGDYKNAGSYAGKSLKITSELVDFNLLDREARYVFSTEYDENPEILFFSNIPNIAITGSLRFDAEPDILASYEVNDLRKQAYFFEHASGRILFKASYNGAAAFFTGIGTDEVLLIRAECYARDNDLALALEDLNTLLKNRYDKETFVPKNVNTAEDALKLILEERKKELLLRGLRWEDLRRLNQDPRFEQTLTRELNGKVYELKPNDLKYVWPIPDNEIELNGLEQNRR